MDGSFPPKHFCQELTEMSTPVQESYVSEPLPPMKWVDRDLFPFFIGMELNIQINI